MKRFILALPALLLAFSGCVSGAGPDQADAPSEGGSDWDILAERVNRTSDAVAQNVTFDAASIHFTNSLVRRLLTAQEDLKVSGTYEGGAAGFGGAEQCLVTALSAPGGVRLEEGRPMPDRDPPALAFVHFQGVASLDHVRANLGNQRVDKRLLLPPYPGEDRSASEEFAFLLHAGDTILVEQGGSSNAILTSGFATLTLSVTGPFTTEELPDSRIRCGTSWHQSDEVVASAEAPTIVGSAAVKAKVSLKTETASSAYFTFEEGVMVEGRGTLTFLDKTVRLEASAANQAFGMKEVREHADRPGEMRFDIETWVLWSAGYSGWILADADWPSAILVTPRMPL
ncbi:MAG: hypothetical protein HYT80_07425 [Euryarchaeota archaeon]|nr:hypothetical protein [Euryarchaeota archaeon]